MANSLCLLLIPDQQSFSTMIYIINDTNVFINVRSWIADSTVSNLSVSQFALNVKMGFVFVFHQLCVFKISVAWTSGQFFNLKWLNIVSDYLLRLYSGECGYQ